MYNNKSFNHPPIKKYKKNKHVKQRISRKPNTHRITSENKKFLKALGFKVLV